MEASGQGLLPPHLLAHISTLCHGLDAARHRICRALTPPGVRSCGAAHCCDAVSSGGGGSASSMRLDITKLSIVIPALNEEALAGRAIQSAAAGGLGPRPPEIIVADGGSTDDTVRIARRQRAKVVSSARGRGTQMNAGAQVARGDVLLFLHADSRLPEGYHQAMQQAWSAAAAQAAGRQIPRRALRQSRAEACCMTKTAQRRWGCFESIQLDGDSSSLRAWLVHSGVRWRTHALGAPYGDQAIFVERSTFRRIGGFRDWPLLEDVDLAERLRRLGPPVVVPRPVLVSARRWDRLGLLRTFLLNQYILCAWKCGMPPDKLAEVYSPGSGK